MRGFEAGAIFGKAGEAEINHPILVFVVPLQKDELALLVELDRLEFKLDLPARIGPGAEKSPPACQRQAKALLNRTSIQSVS